MSLINQSEIRSALLRLGELAAHEGQQVELIIIGGAAMALQYNARSATKDVDVVVYKPEERSTVWRLSKKVASELGLPSEWLNDAAKGYVSGFTLGSVVLEAPGIKVFSPGPEQLLAMKLSAWRDDVDVADATRLLMELPTDKELVWSTVQKFLVTGSELKAQYALDDLWETVNEDNG
jgi:predicted nucleotidyltransferase